jgi:transposase InsO family protein
VGWSIPKRRSIWICRSKRPHRGGQGAGVAKLPFQVDCIQTDNGSEFGSQFHWHVLDKGIQHRYIRPRRPYLNGKTERSHRIDDEEFYRPRGSGCVWAGGAEPQLAVWERFYNFERPMAAWTARHPMNALRQRLTTPSSVTDVS